MHYLDKGEQQYLRCNTSRLVKTDEEIGERICDAGAISYGHFKNRFFRFVTELKVSAILPNPDEHQAQLEQLDQRIEANIHQIQELENKEANLADSIASTDSREVRQRLEQQLEEGMATRKELGAENEERSRQLAELSKEAEQLRASRNSIEEFNELYEAAGSEEERKDLRIKMRGEIRWQVSRIEIYPSEKAESHFERVLMQFHGSEPYSQLVLLTEDGWKGLIRGKAPKN